MMQMLTLNVYLEGNPIPRRVQILKVDYCRFYGIRIRRNRAYETGRNIHEWNSAISACQVTLLDVRVVEVLLIVVVAVVVVERALLD